ncbi:MAG: sulfatase-like hydrolase/transferase [Parabacteroides sp.]|jgi:phosphoglycerol transferase MdoB-like AlkP superfamily enzyme|uniref:Phosphoglycerol transferase MdoB-like AlkP superfamily enzyme n=2 Tax=root TaxID=1 RepID=A0A8E2A0Z2_9PORP|nr:alkaline phosphatase family protein [Macellibacteroides fermentans]MBP7939036.1 sulfatase-like hydrolase/transferase [Parabacteroides sp.]MDD3508650.1 sulfatase-like hydrolase/transferase [Parabacteroides sp.]MDD4432801.1 sulfatase-like hydrolase/transferase [Parabacteroides sp.]MEA4807834.1 sulfatase-like hydrolase/transferase [Macellibacteroides fermentans]NYI49438.1 phosphoglycerol transferase MdoB-like AlkP superfamily enzyme [Macellibacteroides fermentans]
MKKRVLFLFACFITFILVFALQKPVFMLYNHASGGGLSISDYLQVMVHGLQLDATVAGYLTVIPLLLTLLSVWIPGRYITFILKGYFFIVACIISLIFVVDIALYPYWGFRLDATPLFYLQSPSDALASAPASTLILQTLVFVVYTYGIFWALKRFVLPLMPEQYVKKMFSNSVQLVLLGGILFIPIRGGVTTSTANVGMVYFSKNQFLNHSAINPCFSFLASLSKQQDFAAQYNYFSESQRSKIFKKLTNQPQGDSIPELLTTKNPNIILILMESFSANAIEVLGGEAGVTPNINRLSKEGILFSNMYANSFRTDRGIVAVLNGYLAQPTTSIMKYPAKSQTLPSIAKSLQKKGYTSDMLYGGDINFTNMQSYFFSSGYSKVTADRDFPLKSRLSKWGANDDITFAHLYQSMTDNSRKEPFFSTFLTLSSHEPFEVPYNRLKDPYLNSVAFTDSCLGDFIDKLKKLPLWNNTLIVLVSDHGFRYPASVKEHDPKRYHIPMLWLGGAIKEPRVIANYGNQTDLAATLLYQLDLPHKEFTFSNNMVDSLQPAYAFYSYNNGFGFIDTTGVSVYDCESEKPLIIKPEAGNEIRLNNGKALLQTLYDDLGSR